MIPSQQPAPEDAIPPNCPLRSLGWDDDALQARARARRLFQGWLATGVVDLADIPALAEFAPLVRLAHSNTPAAEEAALLLMMLEAGRLVATQTFSIAQKPTLPPQPNISPAA